MILRYNVRARSVSMQWVVATSLLMTSFGVCGKADAQTTANPYQSLDDKTKAARTYASTQLAQEVSEEITARLLFGPFPQKFHDRLAVAELDAFQGKRDGITESALADAINDLGQQLGGALFTGTNALQLRLLRVAFYKDLPVLLKSPTIPPDNSLVGADMSPMGAAFIGLLLLRQKLTNPIWFGNPDEQNTAWINFQKPHSFPPLDAREPAEVVGVVNRISSGLRDETSAVSIAFGRFLDRAGF